MEQNHTLLDANDLPISKPIDLVNHLGRVLERARAIVETVINNSCEGYTSYQSIPDQHVVLLLEQASSIIDDVRDKVDELWKVCRGRAV